MQSTIKYIVIYNKSILSHVVSWIVDEFWVKSGFEE